MTECCSHLITGFLAEVKPTLEAESQILRPGPEQAFPAAVLTHLMGQRGLSLLPTPICGAGEPPVAHSFHPAGDGLWALPEPPEAANGALGRTSWRSWTWCGYFRQDLPWSWVMVWLCSATCAPFSDGFTPAKWQGQVQMISMAYWSSQAPLCPVLPIFNIRVMSFYPRPWAALQQYLEQYFWCIINCVLFFSAIC